jgi:hypothetical protein
MPHLILLDIDGVLAPYNGGREPEQTVWEGGIRNEGVDVGGGLRLTCAHYPALIAEVNRLIDSGARVEMLTSWRQDVPLFIEHTGMREVPWHAIPKGSSEDDLFDWWKLAVVNNIVIDDPELHIFWADDDIDFDPKAREWLAGHPQVVPLCPPTERGLTPDDIAALDKFINEHPN